MRIRRITMASLALTALGAVLLSTAWACTGQPQVFSVTPLAATAGSEVTMRGGLVAPGRELELRWNGVTGPTLTRTVVDEEATFAMAFTLPEDAEPGVYSVVAVSDDQGVGVGRSAIEVLADPGAEQAAVGSAEGFAAEEAPGLNVADQADPVTAPLVAGVALLSLGVAGLFAGFALATVQRRRAMAQQPRS